MVTIHTVAGLVLFPWGMSASQHAPNDAALRSMGFRQSYFNGYETGQPPEVLYAVSGTTDDWSYDALGIASFTWELDGVGAGCTGTFFPLVLLHGRLRGEQPARARLRRSRRADAVQALARPDSR